MKEEDVVEKLKMEPTFEDVAFEMLSTVSPVKLPREDIPFDSVREIVLSEIIKSKQQKSRGGVGGRNMDELLLDEAPSSSSSSSHVAHDGESSSILERGTMTDDTESTTPRPIAANRLYGDCARSSSTCSSSAPCLLTDSSETRKKPLNYREKRLLEVRQARLKKYRESAEVVEFKCEENCLSETFVKYYTELLTEESTSQAATLYFRIVESLDVFFRAKTWESNCPKLLCEFVCDHILKSCQQLNDYHDSKNSTDEKRAKECQIQVLLTLHVFVVTDDRKYLDEAINKLRMIYIAVGADRLRNFVEETVTDVYCELMGEGLATIYDELCISLPADLQHLDTTLFKMTEADEHSHQIVGKRRNGAANRLEQMLLETSSDLGVGGVEKSSKTTELRKLSSTLTVAEAPLQKRKRRADEVPKELLSPARSSRSTAGSFKQFFVEDTPDEKYLKMEEFDEEVKQTPVAKMRAADSKNSKRCSKRLSDLVKLSEERAQIPRKARENFEKILEKASTPIRSIPRPTRKSLLLGTTPTSTPNNMSTRGSRTSLLSKFAEVSSDRETSVESKETTPVPTRRRQRLPREVTKHQIKQELDDAEFDEIESSPSKSSSSSQKWTDRQLKKQLGLTREDLNRYREAMLTTGARKTNASSSNKNGKINWESAQVNRAGRVKGAGGGENGAPIFGIRRKNVRTMICHVLLNDTNPDTSFDWNKVKFDAIDDDKRLTRNGQAYMEQLKQKYIESKSSPQKRRRSSTAVATSSQVAAPKKSSPKLDAFGFEIEAED